MPRVDMLLAQKYAGAAGKGRRAVTIEWNQVKDMTPWRYTMATAIGVQPPADLMKQARRGYALLAAAAPALGLAERALYVERATMANQKIVPLDQVEPMSSPYFSLIIVPGEKWQG